MKTLSIAIRRAQTMNVWPWAVLVAGLALACDPAGDSGPTLVGAPDAGGDMTPGPEAPGVERLKSALPDTERMTIRMPSELMLVDNQATFYGFTRQITLNVNGFVRNITNVIEDIVELPPTETDGETYAVWGPHTDALSPATWRVRVDLIGEASFEYRVEGWPKNTDEAQAVVVLEGTHEERPGPHRGVGSWTYHLTAGHQLDPIGHDSVGDVTVAYDFGDARALEVRFVEVQAPHDPMATSSLYRYTEAADRSGTFDFISNLDIHADDDPALDRREVLRVRSRWLATGPGRADIVATHGDLVSGAQLDAVECWDAAFVQTYIMYAFGGDTHDEGDAATCPYADRQQPDFEDFNADAFADDALIDAIPQPGDFDGEAAPIDDPGPEPAAYYALARDVINGLNQYVQGVLDLLREMTRRPPNDCTAEPHACTWGPWTDWDKGVTSKLTIQEIAPAQFAYALTAKPFGANDDGWLTVIEGGFTRVEESGDDGYGDGWFIFDFDALGAVDPNEQTRGAYRAEFARAEAVNRLAVRVDGIVDPNAQAPYDARYFLTTDADGGGVLDVLFAADIDNDPQLPARETVDARIRWIEGGAGVGNVRVTAGDLPETVELLGAQCWDGRAVETHVDYVRQDQGGEQRPSMNPDACVFDTWEDTDFPAMGDEL